MKTIDELYTIDELNEMTRKQLRDYLMINLNKVIATNLTKKELIIMVIFQIGIKQ